MLAKEIVTSTRKVQKLTALLVDIINIFVLHQPQMFICSPMTLTSMV